MQLVDIAWRGLADGRARAQGLETDLKERWSYPVRQASDERNAAADAAWQSAEVERRRRYEDAIAAWQYRQHRRRGELEHDRERWTQELRRHREQSVTRLRRALVAIVPAPACRGAGADAV